MSNVKRKAVWLCIAVLAAPALLTGVVVLRGSRNTAPFSPPDAIEAKWGAAVPGVGNIMLVGVVETGQEKPHWWTPTGERTKREFPTGGNEYSVHLYSRHTVLQEYSSGLPRGFKLQLRTGTGKGGSSIVFRLEFSAGLPRDFTLQGRTGTGKKAYCNVYNLDGANGPANRYACIGFDSVDLPRRDDLYVGIATGKPTFIATEQWPSEKVSMKGARDLTSHRWALPPTRP